MYYTDTIKLEHDRSVWGVSKLILLDVITADTYILRLTGSLEYAAVMLGLTDKYT